jgi:hypothetical protein
MVFIDNISYPVGSLVMDVHVSTILLYEFTKFSEPCSKNSVNDSWLLGFHYISQDIITWNIKIANSVEVCLGTAAAKIITTPSGARQTSKQLWKDKMRLNGLNGWECKGIAYLQP